MSYDVSFVLRRVERDMSTKGELARRRAVDGMRSDYAEAARRFGLCPSLHAFARLRAAAAALLENGGHDACGGGCDEDVPSV